jgi:tetratricopeptide (TPR) repeat protein
MNRSIKFLLLLVCTTFFLQGYAQKPEPVVSVVREIHDFDWYETQAKAWKQEIDKGTSNALAWVYWSEANRMARDFCDKAKWESKMGDYFVSKAQLMGAAEKTIPNTFEFYYLKMQAERNNKATVAEYLDKAQSLRPFDNLLLPWLMNRSLVENDKAGMTQVAKNWFQNNEMPQEVLTTAYNMLVSLDSNAILMTNGDNDSYPCWVLQYALNIRPDVLVLNLPMAAHTDSYIQKVFAAEGIKPLVFQNDSDRNSTTIFQHLIKNVTGRPVYLSLFAPDDIYKGFSKSMYMIGFAMKYSPKPFDNLAVLRNNVEKKYLMDFLKQPFTYQPYPGLSNMFRSSYLSTFKMLYDAYQKSGDRIKAKNIKELALKVAKDANRLDWVNNFWK